MSALAGLALALHALNGGPPARTTPRAHHLRAETLRGRDPKEQLWMS